MLTPKTFGTLFRDLWKTAGDAVEMQEGSVSRIVNVHPSQIPICPTALVVGFFSNVLLDFENNRYGIRSPHTFFSDMILDTGTTVHEVTQRYLGRSELAFGDFYCPNCGEVFYLRTGGCCPNCHDIYLHYKEVGIDYKGFAGHVDFMIKKDGELWLVDFKTSADRGIAHKVKETPQMYDLQTLAYCLLLKKQYNLDIAGRAICYISRDNFSFRLGGVQRIEKSDLRRIFNILKAQKDLLNFLLDCSSYKEYMKHVGLQRCSNPYCKYCTQGDKQIESQLKEAFSKGYTIREAVNRVQAEKDKAKKIAEGFASLNPS